MTTDIKNWMPIWIGDYLADTSRLTTQQHGAYFLLMMDYWKKGAPPDDDKVLAQITKLSAREWRSAKAVLKHFFSITGGHWRHKRIDEEITKAIDNREKVHSRAVAGAAARWGAKGNAQALLKQCPPPSPSPSPLSNKPKQHTVTGEFGFFKESDERRIRHAIAVRLNHTLNSDANAENLKYVIEQVKKKKDCDDPVAYALGIVKKL